MRLLRGAIAGYRLVFGGEYLLGGDFSVNLVFSAFAVCFSPMEKDGCPMLNEAKESVLLSFLFLALRQPKPENRKQDFSP